MYIPNRIFKQVESVNEWVMVMGVGIIVMVMGKALYLGNSKWTECPNQDDSL